MKHINVEIKDRNWKVSVWLSITTYYSDKIIKEFKEMKAGEQLLTDAEDVLKKANLNTGLCYSNTKERKSLIVTAKGSSKAEILDSIIHECMHVVQHVSEADNIDMQGEIPCYMIGDLVRDVYNSADIF